MTWSRVERNGGGGSGSSGVLERTRHSAGGEAWQMARDEKACVTGDDLVERGCFVEGGDGADGGRVSRVEGDGVGEMDFGNTDAGGFEGGEGCLALVVFDGEVAGVVIQSDAAAEGFRVWGGGGEFGEKGDGFVGVFEVAERFGFQAEVEVVAGLVRENFDFAGQGDEVADDGGFVGVEGFERAGQGGDGALGTGWQQGG